MKTLFTSKTINILFINENKTDLAILQASLGQSCLIINAKDATVALEILENTSIHTIISNERTNNNLAQRVAILKKIKLEPQFSHIKFLAFHNADKTSHNLIKQGFDDAFIKAPIVKDFFEINC